jgi:hypothetical protein
MARGASPPAGGEPARGPDPAPALPPPLVLLGPQRFDPVLRGAVDELGVAGPIAAVTAGWQEREGEDEELRDHLGGRTVNLRLYARCEEAFAADPELFAAHRDRQNQLRDLQRLYRLRLDHALAGARELQREREADPEIVEPERRAALAAVRALDARQLARVAAIDRRFEERWRPAERPAVARHRRELAAILADCGALAVAGGHVAVLLNRLRLFGIAALAAGKPIFAWSAGAMALGRRIVLFHDSPPQGAGNAEVLEHGLGCCPGVVPLPHAGRRLRLDDPRRVSLLAGRCAPLAPVTLDPGALLVFAGDRLVAARGARRLTPHGRVVELRPAATAEAGR